MGRGEAGKMNIWRVNTDGSGAKQISFGGMDAAPLCSPDGKMAYYADQVTLQVMRVPVDDADAAGKAEMVPWTAIPKEIYTAGQLDISRDGKFLAFSVGGLAEPHAGGRIAVVPIGGATPGKGVKLLYPDSRIGPDLLNFTPDGKAVVYVIRENGVENLWAQPVDGGSGKQITNFTADGIREFEFSPDGKMLGVLQEHVESDVVLLQDTTEK
jgi:Tol biopolymer transport system component